MIEHDQLAKFLDDALAPGPRSDIERRLGGDEEALQFVIEQRKLDRTLRSLLGPAAHKQRLKESILSIVVGATSEELRARILADTSHRETAPTSYTGTTPLELQRTDLREGSNLAGKLRDWVRENIQLLKRLAQARFALSAVAVIVSILGVLSYAILQRPTARIEVGQFASVVGSPRLQHSARRQTLKAQSSTAVRLGDRIETGDGDQAEIRFLDGTTLQLNFNTTIQIPTTQSLTRDAKSQSRTTTAKGSLLQRPAVVDLLSGQVWSKVSRSTNGTRFVVRTPVASASVKGTEFGLKLKRMSAAAGSSKFPKTEASKLVAVLSVKEGAVEFSNSHGNVEATALTESSASNDAAPTQPKQLGILKSFMVADGKALNVANDEFDFGTYNVGVRFVYPLGWSGLELSAPQKGAVPTNGLAGFPRVIRVWSNSPADRAGLAVGDLVVEVNGRPIRNASDVLGPIFYQTNKTVGLVVMRAGSARSMSFTTSNHPWALPTAELPTPLGKELFAGTWPIIEEICGNRTNFGEGSNAPASLEQMLQRYPDVAPIHNNLGVWYERRGKVDSAITHLKQAIQIEPNDARYHYNLGLVLCEIGNFERSQEEMDAALRLQPDSVPLTRGLAKALHLLGRSEEALVLLERGLHANPLSAILWDAKALILLTKHRPDEALSAASKCVELEPSDAVRYRNLALVQWARGDLATAEATARRSIELDPDSAEGHNTLALVLVGHLKGKIYEDPMAVPVEQLQIDHWINREPEIAARLIEAVEQFRRAIELDPLAVATYANLGKLYFELGQPEEGKKMWNKAIEIDPSPEASAKYNNDAAWYFALWNIRLDEALDSAQRAVQSNPLDVGYIDTLGLVYFRRAEFPQAEAAFKRCIELGWGDSASTWFHLGKVYERENQVPAAIAAYEKALTLETNYPAASTALDAFRR